MAYSAANCSDGAPCAPLSVMPTPHKFWRNGKTMEPSNLSRFGLTCAVLTANHGGALLMSCLADFRAKTSVPQAKAQASQAHAQVCGKKWQGLLATYNHDTHLWKTAQCSLLEDSMSSLETWPKWGMTHNGAAYLRQTWVPTTSASVSGYSPKSADTPSGNWPTRTCSDVMTASLKSSQQKVGSMHSVTLPQGVRDAGQTFPTPQASDNRDRGNLSNASVQRRIEIGKQVNLSQSVSKTSGKLNPHWVCWLMQWPIGWADLTIDASEAYTHWQQQGAIWWQVEPTIPRTASDIPNTTEQLTAIGNGQVPLCAATAFNLLQQRFDECLEKSRPLIKDNRQRTCTH